MLGHNIKMTGAQCLADMLKGYGVTHVFMVPAVLRRTFAEMERRTSIKRLHCHGEKAAAYMADGYARASGKPGICMAQVVGALNLAAGLRDAYLAHSPVIAFTGGREAKTKFRKVYQEIDDLPAYEPVTKWNATVDAVERFPDMVRQAFRVATSGAPGPVHLQFRGNEGQIDQEEAELEPLVEAQFARVPPYRPLPDPRDLKRLLDELQRAERPVIVAGGGVRASGAGAELVQLAEALALAAAGQENLRRVAREVSRDARIRRGADPAGAHLRRALAPCARGCDRARRYRARRHVDGRHVRRAKRKAELHQERRSS